MKIYVTGPSGVGTTTLAKDLSTKLSIKLIDSDDLFWLKTNPPYTQPRSADELHEMFHEAISSDSFVLSSDVLNWGLDDSLLDQFTQVIFLYLPFEVREQRIKQREEKRFGERIFSGGDMYKQHESFIKWTKKYDENHEELGRNRRSQEDFLSQFKGEVMRVDKVVPKDILLQKALNFLE